MLRAIVVFVFAVLGVVASAHPAVAAQLTIDSLVVRLRDGVVTNPSAGLPSSEQAILFAQVKIPFSVIGFTRDGALQLRLSQSISLDAARAAVNRVRMLPEVLYANVVAPLPGATAIAGALPVGTATASINVVPVQPRVAKLIVKFRDASITSAAQRNSPLPKAQVDRLTGLAGQPVAQDRAMSGGAFVVHLLQAVPADQARSVAALMAADPNVEYAEPDRLMQPLLVPNDPLYASQWNYMSPPAQMGGANLPPAWDITTGSSNIIVAVIDTGSLAAHPDLAGRYIGGYDFISDSRVANDGDARDGDASDPGDWITAAENASGFFAGCGTRNSSFHGTHVAGTIGAASNNGIGVTGINWVSKILPARVLGKCGGYLSDIADAIRWSAGLTVPGVPDNPNPARVLNLSLGGYACDSNGQNCVCDTTSQSAITAALGANAVVVIAAGNSNLDAISSTPGNCNGVITVGATGHAGQRASYSNWGSYVEISAPGGAGNDGGVLSTLNSGAQSPDPAGYDYAVYQGTSMATPHVAGIASLMLSRNPSLTPSQVVAKIQTTARAFPTGTVLDCTTALCGAGIIDAGAAVAAAGGITSSTTTLTSAPNPATTGVSVTFTATVAGTVPTGSVAFTENGVALSGCGAVALTGSGSSRTAACGTSSLAAGVHSIVASYTGDSINTASTSTPLSQVVNTPPALTTTTLVGSGSPVVVGTSVTLTATVVGANPTGIVSFTEASVALGGCSAVALSGSGNSKTAVCTTSSLTVGTHNIVANYGGDAGNASSASAALAEVVNSPPGSSNVALASAGAVATASSTLGSGYPVSAVNNNERTGAGWSVGGGWNDATPGVFPDWVQINFNGSKTIDHVVVYSMQDNYANPIEPTDTLTGSIYAITGFTVQGWDGANWVTLATVTGNNLIKRTASFAAYTTDRIRLNITGSQSGWSSLIELEAWGVAGPSLPASTTTLVGSGSPVVVGTSVTLTATVVGANPTGIVSFTEASVALGGCSAVALSGSGNSKTAVCTTSSLTVGTHNIVANYGGDAGNASSASAALAEVVNSPPGSSNVALASAGAVATASSTLGSGYPVSAVNNNERTGAGWSVGGGWNDATPGVFPDWVQINFNGSKTIDHVVVYSMQDNYANPIEPTDTLTGSIYAITGFTVQGWDGANWVTLATVTGNNLIKRTASFAAYTTDRIRLNITGSQSGWSSLIELEAWGVAGPSLPASTTTLVGSGSPVVVGTSVTLTATVVGANPTGIVSFTEASVALGGCSAVALSGSGNSKTAVCTTSSLTVGTHNIVANYGGDAGNASSASAALAEVVNSPPGSSNVALASAGAVATASSTLGSGYPVSAVNNNERTGAGWSVGGGWNDATPGVFPDWVQINFNGSKTIDHVVVYSMQDNYANPIEPTDTLTGSIYAITGFTVQGWDGANWVTLATVTGNNLIKRTASFAAYTTDRIRLNITGSQSGWSSLIELEAWGVAGPSLPASTTTLVGSGSPVVVGTSVTLTATVVGANPTGIVSFTEASVALGGCSAVALSGSGNSKTAVCTTSSLTVGTHNIVANYGGDAGNASSASAALAEVVNSPPGSSNVALASAGAVATASSTLGSGYPVSAVNNNERTGAGWSVGGGWNDATPGVFPDWVQINFNGSKTIDHVVVYSMQDNYANPIEPTDTLTGSIYAITGFTVQGWDGANWVTLATVTGNNLIKRTASFAAYTTDRIRLNITGSQSGWSSLIELEAWGVAGPSLPASTTTLVGSGSPVVVGTSVTLTATVVGANPTGIVSFTEASVALGGCSAVALSGSGNSKTAVCTTSSLTVGTHNIVANYGGDAGNASSASAALAEVVNSPPGSSNVALASAGAVATASSTLGSGYPVSAVNNNERTGAGWSVGGGWNDATPGVFPDWVQINFNGSKTIDHVVVYSMQDNYANPIEPTDTLTGSIYAITGFTVQGWDGANWVTLATVTGNNLIKRTASFAAYTTDRIRLNITGSQSGWSSLIELEAWGI